MTYSKCDTFSECRESSRALHGHLQESEINVKF